MKMKQLTHSEILSNYTRVTNNDEKLFGNTKTNYLYCTPAFKIEIKKTHCSGVTQNKRLQLFATCKKYIYYLP